MAVMGRRKEPLEGVAAQLRSAQIPTLAVTGDVSERGDVDRVLSDVSARLGPIDLLVNNAGIVEERSFLETDDESWRRVNRINLDGAFIVGQAVARRMMHRGYGSIVNIASVDAHGADGPYASYHTSKHALLGLTRAMAVELGPAGIRVNSVSPGFTDTQMDEWPDHVRDHLLRDFKRVPLRRMMRPAEIASAVSFLLSDDASGITGANLMVDGGMTADLFGVSSLPTVEAG